MCIKTDTVGGGGGGGAAVISGGRDAPGDGLETAPLLASLGDGVGAGVKRSSELWHIHGKHFDLSKFLKHHPGGAGILEAVRGAEDITPLFESYHALAHTAAIRQSLEKFEWTGKLVDDVSEREAALVGGAGKEPVRYSWDEEGFYCVLKARVKKHFLEKHGQGGVDPNKVSVNRFVKAPLSWYLKELLILEMYVPLFAYMLGFDILRLGISFSLAARAGMAVLAGSTLQAFSFCTLHDASHYGLFFKRPRAQEVLSRVCNAWTLWHHGLWVMHHIYGHHSFTGDPERDPDLVHARPYIRKSIMAPKEQYDPVLVRWQGYLAPLFNMIMPGSTLGQTYAYMSALHEGDLWHVSITAAARETRWYEYLTYIVAVGAHFVGGNVFISFCYFMGISVAYHLCVAPDHDTFESAVVNSIEAKRETRNADRGGGRGVHSDAGVVGGRGQGAGDDDSRSSSNSSSGGGGGGGVAPREEEGSGVGGDGGEVVVLPSEEVRGEGGKGAAAGADGDKEEDDDWGEVQVRHSGNFSNGNPFVTHVMGGINYQIEHHLFPSVSHMLYEEIAPIVRQACREFCVPYNAHPSLWTAYRSYLKHVMLCSEGMDTQ